MIDSHTHLDLLDIDPREAVEAASQAGIKRMLTVGTDQRSCARALELADQYESVYFAIGCHPNNAHDLTPAFEDELLELAKHPKCRAIGETGFDFYRDIASRRNQEKAFRFQLELAQELDMPVVIHSREADEETINLLDRYAGGLSVLMHCFAMVNFVQVCLERRWWISFAGNVTYPKNTALANASAEVPDDRVLVETDAPYLTPQARRKYRNQPAFVADTAAFVAAQRGQELAQFQRVVEGTSAELFKWF